jgi:hypothetical protein
MDLAADQKTMLYTQEGRAIKRYDVSSNTALSDFAALPGAGEAFALRILGDGGVLLADGDNIKRLNSSGVVVQTYDATGEDSWFALNLDPDGTSFWSADFTTADVYKFDIASGNVLLHFNTGTGSSTVYGLVVFGELVAGVPPSLALSPELATNNVGSMHTVTATATSNSVTVVGLTVSFSVSGSNSATGSAVTDSSGQCQFQYTGSNPGEDTITASALFGTVIKNAVAHKVWVAVSAPVLTVTPVANRGYYQLTATSAFYTPSQLQVYVKDSASAFVAGPYPSGTVVKIKKSAATGIGPASGPASVTIFVTGDGQAYAVDPAGQVSAVVTCKSL